MAFDMSLLDIKFAKTRVEKNSAKKLIVTINFLHFFIK